MNSFTTAASTTARQKYGYVFFDCKIIADTSVKKVYLGRPWRSYAKTVYIRCNLGPQILPEGWNPWKGDAMFTDKDKTAYYAEYQSTGPGANAKSRVAWSHQLTAAEAKEYTLANIFSGRAAWEPGK
jgi:pectinesterase